MSEFGPSLDDVLRVGEDLYLNTFKERLEKDYLGQYVVIDVEKKDYTVDENQLAAVEAAKAKFGQKLFFIVKIGSLDKPSVNYRKTYARNL